MKGGNKVKKRIICFVFSSILLSSCSFQQTVKEEKQFVGNADGAVDRVSGPVSLKNAKKYFPESFKAPTYLPYDVMNDVKGEVRTIGTKNAVLTIKYRQQEKGRKDYVELTVANFSYSFPYIVERNRFHEKMKLDNGSAAYFKNRDEGEQGEEFATLIWKEKGLEYQLLYRNVESRNEKVVKQNLLYIANNMEEKN
ncbi:MULTISPECIES: hypothetical protein [Bacillus]|uniref:DNA polymerase III subunit delta n=1 Tax=Bacillus pseudomycoides TaxID=64104 RepID=A0A1Y3MJY6_9BACI|nr:hypothetical protein [Bacillus pseudomycoides]EOQ03445.1 hypothetical protein KOY_01295 [Bacillus cereus VDM021]MDF2082699.1 DNA polymerase III subunit delta [Bacillus pseudomycoides]OUM50749.1 DNA polymerase III subunit delta [Bacillus pseudomycoides]